MSVPTDPAAGPPLPELHEQWLDGAMLETLFSDLAALGDGVEARLKGGAGIYAGPGEYDLATARGLWERGEARGLQIRYRWEGRAWLDTLFLTPEGVRLVRMGVDPRSAAG